MKCRILVVDDEDQIRNLFVEVLNRAVMRQMP